MSILDQGKSFSVSYQWTGDASTVKGFPYMKLSPSRLPVQLWNVSTLQFSGKWTTIVEGTDGQSPQQQAKAYDDIGLKVNSAIDMFLSDDVANSTEVGPPIEIMIWLWYVPAILPLGHAESTPDKDVVEVDGTKFSLYHGWNAQGQHVFSWLAQKNMTSTDADYSPLLKYIWQKGLLSGALYLGQLEFGTEVMHAGLPTTFTATDYNLALYRQGDKDDPNPQTTSASNSTATSTASRTPTATTSPTRSATPSASTGAAPQSLSISTSSRNSCIALSLTFALSWLGII